MIVERYLDFDEFMVSGRYYDAGSQPIVFEAISNDKLIFASEYFEKNGIFDTKELVKSIGFKSRKDLNGKNVLELNNKSEKYRTLTEKKYEKGYYLF